MNICVAPYWKEPDRGDGGIRRVIEAMEKYLPAHGMYVTPDIEGADLINNHAHLLVARPDVPMVASCHGLHWSDYNWPKHMAHINRSVRENLIVSDGWTAPSQWVRTAMTRGMAIDPQVMYHGTDIPDRVQPSEGYILWNKTRLDAVCDAGVVRALAALLPQRQFVTTHMDGAVPSNVYVTGKMPHAAALDHVARAGLYLATVQETFGIGTIEALAAGVPVVGYDFGGQSEIIVNGETGILVPRGDIAALAEAIEAAFQQRSVLGTNAREDAIARWQWPDKIEQYARYFQDIHDRFHQPRPRVSLLVAYRNLGPFIGDTIQSAVQQNMADWEMVIVDDASDPDQAAIAKEAAEQDDRIRYVRSEENLRPARARNLAASLSRGRYLMPLDADDMLAPLALATLADELDKDRTIAIAYGHLDTMSEDGTNRRRNPWPPEVFDWHGQMRRANQMPYCPMMRREVWLRTGGQRQRERSVEDAGLWCRATSVGFRAKKVTEASTIWYRLRHNSWSKQGGQEYDWTAWLAWRYGATIPPWGAQGDRQDGLFWPVPSHTRPHVSVIIPVGPGHEKYLPDALDSVFYSQRYPWWECIVVNDTGKEWAPAHEWGSPVQGAAWATVVDNHGPQGVASARNAGLQVARAPLVLFLDADDYLLPDFLEATVPMQAKTGGIVYTDCLIAKAPGDELELHQFEDFRADAVKAKMPHANTVLIPRVAIEEVGGYDTSLRGWEDWDLFIALRKAGWCSTRVGVPGFVYRHMTGQRREESLSRQDEVLGQLKAKHGSLFVTGELDLMACGCSKSAPVGGATVIQQNAALSAGGYDAQHFSAVEYVGPEIATRTWMGQGTGSRYRFAATPERRIQLVDLRDIGQFRNHGDFVIRG